MVSITDALQNQMLEQLRDYLSRLEIENEVGIESISPKAHKKFHESMNCMIDDVKLSIACLEKAE